MRVWSTSFQVYRSMPSFPYPGTIEEEIQDNPSYHCEGKLRHGGVLLYVYTLKGRGIFRANGVEYDMTPGKGFICDSGDENIAWYYPEETTIPWQFLWISYYGKTAEAMVNDLTNRHGHIYDFLITDSLIKRLLSFRQYQHRIYPLSPTAGADLVYYLLNSLAARFETKPLNPRNLLIKQAQELILERITSEVTVEKIAQKLRLSREHFSRLFHRQTGLSPAEFILRQKILRSCHLLKETRLSCKEIAHRLGYQNATNFSRAFKNILQMTPKEFRSTGTMPLF